MMRTEYVLKESGLNPLGLYIVKEGDTARSVCAKFGVPPSLLISENRLKEFPPAGSWLILPVGAETYTVQAGDTIASVCRKFGLSEEDFIRLNGPYIYPTQRVCVGTRKE